MVRPDHFFLLIPWVGSSRSIIFIFVYLGEQEPSIQAISNDLAELLSTSSQSV
jgi:hypothetical protein